MTKDKILNLISRYNKMLPNSHFEKIEKGAIDHINPSSAKPITKEENSPKKVVEIKEKALDKNTKAIDDDDDAYDYYNDNEYDDDDNEADDIVTVTPKVVSVTPKVVSNKMCKCKFTFQEEEAGKKLSRELNFNNKLMFSM